MIVGRTLIFKLGGVNGVTVVCCDFTSAISVLTDSSSSSPTIGSFSGGLGPADDEGERKTAETRFMVMVEEGWGLEGFRGEDWRYVEGFYTRWRPRASGAYSLAHIPQPFDSDKELLSVGDRGALGCAFGTKQPGEHSRVSTTLYAGCVDFRLISMHRSLRQHDRPKSK